MNYKWEMQHDKSTVTLIKFFKRVLHGDNFCNIIQFNTSWKFSSYFYKIYVTNMIWIIFLAKSFCVWLFCLTKYQKKKENDNFSISSILYNYYDIQILEKFRIFFMQSIVFMIILMKFSPPPNWQWIFQPVMVVFCVWLKKSCFVTRFES